jgi:hypothetical protein
MSCGLSARLYALETDSNGEDKSDSAGSGLEMDMFEKAAVEESLSSQSTPASREDSKHTLIYPICPLFSFLQAEGSFGAAVVVIFIDVKYFLARARQGSSAASVRWRNRLAWAWQHVQSEKRLLQAGAHDEDVPFCVVESVHCGV